MINPKAWDCTTQLALAYFQKSWMKLFLTHFRLFQQEFYIQAVAKSLHQIKSIRKGIVGVRYSWSEPYLDLTDVGEIVLVAVDVIPMIQLSPLVCSECLDAVVNLGENDTLELSTRGHVRHSSGIEVHDVFNQLVITPIFNKLNWKKIVFNKGSSWCSGYHINF